MTMPNIFMDSNRALTFSIGDTYFGIDVKYILAFTDVFGEIKSGADQVPGFLGYLDYRDRLVKVFECATILGRKKERDNINELIGEIATYKVAHTEWVSALEQSIIDGSPFTKARNPKMCAFGKWYYSFKTDDEGLRALLDKIEEPHNQIHSLADNLLSMRTDGQAEDALKVLRLEKSTTLKKLLRILDFIVEYLQVGIHPVVLHLTQDGQTPWFSLVLDDIHEILYYDPAKIDYEINSDNSSDPVEGYVRNKNDVSFMMLSVDKLHHKLVEKFKSVA